MLELAALRQIDEHELRAMRRSEAMHLRQHADGDGGPRQVVVVDVVHSLTKIDLVAVSIEPPAELVDLEGDQIEGATVFLEEPLQRAHQRPRRLIARHQHVAVELEQWAAPALRIDVVAQVILKEHDRHRIVVGLCELALEQEILLRGAESVDAAVDDRNPRQALLQAGR